MATFHVIYDPTDRLTVDTSELHKAIHFVSLRIDVDVESYESVGEVTRKLAELLITHMKP
jgi:hypothetical protein